MAAQKDLVEKFKDEAKQFIMGNLEDYKKLKDGVIHIYKTYSLEDKKEVVESDDDDKNKTAGTTGGAKKSKKGGAKSKDGDIFYDHFVKREHLEEELKQARDSIIKNKKFHQS